MWGFESLKDLLEVLLIPAVGGAIALYWPELQRRQKRRQFEGLIERELEELAPYREKMDLALRSWTEYQRKEFLHKRILEDVAKNRDFILSLDPTLVYQVSQLWDARRNSDQKQWRFYLKELAKRYPRYPQRVEEARKKWKDLFKELEAHSA